MRTDPEPCKDVPFPDGNSAVGIGDANRPELADRLQLNRGMLWVRNESSKLLIGAPLNVFRQFVVPIPKLWEGFRLEDHERDLRRAAKPSSIDRALPSAMLFFTFSTKLEPRPPGEKSFTISLS